MNIVDQLYRKIRSRITPTPPIYIVSFLLLLLSMEFLFQIVAYVRYRKAVSIAVKTYSINRNNWYLKQNGNSWWLDMKLPRIYDPFLGFMTKNIESPYVHVDANGVRKTAYNPSSDPQKQTKRIYFFGGSAVFGANVKDAETVPSFVAKLLNQTNTPYEISNYGQMAYNFSQEVAFLTRQIKIGNIPDTVVFYDGCNEYFSSHLLDEYQQIYDESYIRERIGDIAGFELRLPDNTTLIDMSMWKGLLMTRVKTIDYTMRIIAALRQKLSGQKNMPVKEQDRTIINARIIDNYAQNIRFVMMLSEIYHFTPLFFWQPIIHDKVMTEDEANVNSAALYEKDEYNHMIDSINRLNLPNQYDLTHVFMPYDTTSLFVDNCHVTPQGNEIVAGAMTQVILDKGL